MKDGGQSFEMNVSSATIVRLALWLLVFWFIYSIRKLILIVLISVVIASAVEPAVRWFGRFHVPRTPAVLLVYLLAFILLFSLIPLFFIPVFGDLVQISTTLPEKLSALQSLALPDNFLSSIANSIYFAWCRQPAMKNISSTSGIARKKRLVSGCKGNYCSA